MIELDMIACVEVGNCIAGKPGPEDKRIVSPTSGKEISADTRSYQVVICVANIRGICIWQRDVCFGSGGIDMEGDRLLDGAAMAVTRGIRERVGQISGSGRLYRR